MGNIIKLDEIDAAKRWNKIASYEGLYYQTWAKQCLDNRAFYHGNQATEEEIKKLQERGQYHIVINKIRKAIRGITGLTSASIPKYKLLPIGEKDDVKAAIGNKILDWCWNNSGGVHTFRRVVKDALIDNIKYMHVIYSDKKKRVEFLPLSFDDVIVDPQSKHPMFEDAEMILIRKYMPVKTVQALYGISELTLQAPAYDIGTIDTTVRYNEFIQKVFSLDHEYCLVYEGYKKEYSRNEQGILVTNIIKETILGFGHVYVEKLPDAITEYPIIPVYVEDSENPYKRGEVHFIKDLQRFINKSYGVVLLNAQLMSNPKLIMRETDIPNANLDAFKQNYANPGSISTITGNGEMPMVVQGQPLNQAFFTLYQDAKQEFDLATIPSSLLSMQNTRENPASSQLLDQKESILDAYKDFLSIVDLASTQLGKVILQYTTAYVPLDVLVRLLDDPGSTKRHMANLEKGLDVDDENSVQEFIRKLQASQVEEEQVQQILAQAKVDSELANAIKSFTSVPSFNEFDIVVIPGSYTPTYQMAMLRLMMELSQIGATDPSVVLDYAPVENKAELKQRFDAINVLKRQLEQAQQNINDKDSIIKSLQNAAIKQEISVGVAMHDVKLNKVLTEQRLKNFLIKHKNALDSKEQTLEFKRELEDLLREAEDYIKNTQKKQDDNRFDLY